MGGFFICIQFAYLALYFGVLYLCKTSILIKGVLLF